MDETKSCAAIGNVKGRTLPPLVVFLPRTVFVSFSGLETHTFLRLSLELDAKTAGVPGNALSYWVRKAQRC